MCLLETNKQTKKKTLHIFDDTFVNYIYEKYKQVKQVV